MTEGLVYVSALTGVIVAVAGAVAFLWARVSEVRKECLDATSKLRDETHEDVVRIHERQDDMRNSMVEKGDLDAIRGDFRQLRDQISALNSNLMKFMAGRVPAE